MFQLLKFDAARFETVILAWLPPLKKESLAQYALRMAAQILIPRERVVLVGVSFGGIVAVEIAKIIQPVCTIIISGIKTRTELPGYLRFLGKLHIHPFLPMSWAKKIPGVFAWLFGAETEIELKLLAGIIRDTDISFVKWALTAIITWPNTTLIPNLVHLHGNQDKLFPLSYIREPVIFEGGHLIIFSAAAEISAFINQAATRIYL